MKHDKWIKELVSNTVTFLSCLIIWVVLDPSGTSMYIKKTFSTRSATEGIYHHGHHVSDMATQEHEQGLLEI